MRAAYFPSTSTDAYLHLKKAFQTTRSLPQMPPSDSPKTPKVLYKFYYYTLYMQILFTYIAGAYKCAPAVNYQLSSELLSKV